MDLYLRGGMPYFNGVIPLTIELQGYPARQQRAEATVYNISCKTTITPFPKFKQNTDMIEMNKKCFHNATSGHCSGQGEVILSSEAHCHALEGTQV